MLNRRSVLALFGVAAAKPDIGMQALNLNVTPGVDAVSNLIDYGDSPLEAGSSGDAWGTPGWAIKQVARKKLMNAIEKDHERRSYHVGRLDPDTQSLRSVSLGTKIRISRNRQYDREEYEQSKYLEHVISGAIKKAI